MNKAQYEEVAGAYLTAPPKLTILLVVQGRKGGRARPNSFSETELMCVCVWLQPTCWHILVPG
jgi:hypothetical protein